MQSVRFDDWNAPFEVVVQQNYYGGYILCVTSIIIVGALLLWFLLHRRRDRLRILKKEAAELKKIEDSALFYSNAIKIVRDILAIREPQAVVMSESELVGMVIDRILGQEELSETALNSFFDRAARCKYAKIVENTLFFEDHHFVCILIQALISHQRQQAS